MFAPEEQFKCLLAPEAFGSGVDGAGATSAVEAELRDASEVAWRRCR